MVRSFLFGLLAAFAAAVCFSLLTSLAICCGVDPDARVVSDGISPLLGIFIGAYLGARNSSWTTGAWIGVVYVFFWLEFWFYLSGRLSPILWLQEGMFRLNGTHFFWWELAFLAGIVGGMSGRIKALGFPGVVILSCIVFFALIIIDERKVDRLVEGKGLPCYQVEKHGPESDGTTYYVLTFEFQKKNRFVVGLYDCDSDDDKPYDNSNLSFMGQSLESLVEKLDFRAQSAHRRLLCVINGGFFGATGLSVAHHEEPIVLAERALYHVDMLQPRDQSWFFAVNSPTGMVAGGPRFVMAPSIEWSELQNYQTVLGGVRPVRFEGESVVLKPGAGNTALRCSRTSIGWSEDGDKFYMLVVRDPDGEAASQVQRRLGAKQTGGWDVREVQQFWERQDVPYAVLLDGGESTQLAYQEPGAGLREVLSGYQYSFTVGYLFDKPLLLTLPILPPSEARRGVLNYLYVEGATSR